jgi:hypothetical protein
MRRPLKIEDWMPCCSLHVLILLHPLCDVSGERRSGRDHRRRSTLARDVVERRQQWFADRLVYAGSTPKQQW